MRIVVLGGGPAGLYAATLLKRANPAFTVTVYEQNPRDVTWGFGVVFSDTALSFLQKDDPETYAAILPALETWKDITLDLNGDIVTIDGVGFAAVARLKLLQILVQRAEQTGVDLKFGCPTDAYEEEPEPDLLIAADGVNSRIRDASPASFDASIDHLQNRFAWYGTTKTFPTLTQTFRDSQWGPFNAHHYRYAPTMSTFIVETTPEVWARAGLDTADDDASRRICEEVFGDVLDGHPLISNKSIWRTFPKVWNETWHSEKSVLIGDALHTAHFSIGSGTRLALEDAIALADAVGDHCSGGTVDIPAALQAFQNSRKPIVEKLVAAANRSAAWYERFDVQMKLPIMEFAHSYITRAGRLAPDRLRALAPAFMEAYETYQREVVA